MELFDRLSKLDRRTYWWNISEGGFDIYLNCNDLVCGTAYGVCLYNGSGGGFEDVIEEGLNFLDDFLKKHQKDLDNFYDLYNFASYNELLRVLNEFKGEYDLKYDPKIKVINVLE